MRRWRGNRRLLWLALVLLAAVVVLAALPGGVRLAFSAAGEEAEQLALYYAYFSGMPLFYGNWFPMLCGLLTGITAVLMLVMLLRKRPDRSRENGLKILTMVDVALAVFAMLLVGSFTLIGVAIAILLLCVAMLEFWAM